MTGDLVVDGPTTPASYTVKKDFDVIGTVQGTTPAQFGVTDVTGTGTFNLVTAVQAAIDRSAFYAGLAPTGTISGNAISLNSANQTVNAGVYNITGFSMNSGSILTINGSATDKFVLNISGAFSFDKSFIQLTGGITSANVLFNVTGNDSTATGTAKITGDNSVFFGTLLAVGRNIDIEGIGSHNGSTQGVGCGADGLCDTADDNPGLEGRVIGALGTTANPLLLKVFSGAEVDFPGTPVPEPITMFLGGTGLLTLAYAARKRLFPRPV
jgi:hypothetical protein